MASREWILVRSPKGGEDPRSVIGTVSMGFTSYNTAALPERVYAGLKSASRPPDVLIMQPELDLSRVPTPLETLVEEGDGKGWAQASRDAAARLEAFWLLVEDRYRLLDAQEIEPLAHQASLVEHVLTTPDLKRVLIADEVGLGKTIEAGLIVKRLIDASPGSQPSVLYLTEARLVDNVCEEFERLGLDPRRWVAGNEEARLTTTGRRDPLVVASMHRAVHPNHFDKVAGSGPWDVVIVDEAHHLTDYSEDGGDPLRRMRLVRKILDHGLSSGGRLLLLSGTPHQGNVAKFENVLELLSDLPLDRSNKEERVKDGSGRMIYRIKDDIRGWGGEEDLLFPARQINPPREIHVSDSYRRWIDKIGELLRPSGGSRAGAWRRAQALQWAASSPEAGLGYLVRLAIRSGLQADTFPALREALAALRPYRDGKRDESVSDLEKRIREQRDSDEEEDESTLAQLAMDHAEVLQLGAKLVSSGAFQEKLDVVLELLGDAPAEKFVIFAQPVETVLLLRRTLAQRLGPVNVSLIVGGQSKETRREEIRRFREDAAVRVLVSSRSGGEGINLQVSRRLVHFDVPWNPMEMEQRVGRVHRYGSTSTVIVDTLVLKDSREQRVLERCRARLGQIVADLFGNDPQRFESLFGRTMSMIPMAQIQELMAGEGFDSVAGADGLVEEAFKRWKSAHDKFVARSQKLCGVERGPVGDADLEAFLTATLKGTVEPGWKRRRLVAAEAGKEATLVEEDASVLRIGSELGYVGFSGGIGMVSPGGVSSPVQRLGLNVGPVAEGVLLAIQGKAAGSMRMPADRWRQVVTEARVPDDFRDGGLLLAYVVRHLDVSGQPVRETKSALHLYLCAPDGGATYPLDTAVGARVMRLVREGSAGPRPPTTTFQASALLDAEATRIPELRATKPGEPVRAVFPVAALWLEARDDKGAPPPSSRPPRPPGQDPGPPDLLDWLFK
jgi:superfamily II DNA or RNA helicase